MTKTHDDTLRSPLPFYLIRV